MPTQAEVDRLIKKIDSRIASHPEKTDMVNTLSELKAKAQAINLARNPDPTELFDWIHTIMLSSSLSLDATVRKAGRDTRDVVAMMKDASEGGNKNLFDFLNFIENDRWVDVSFSIGGCL